MMINKRRKGAMAENAIVKYFQNRGFRNAHRRGVGFKGSDILGIDNVGIEVKNWQDLIAAFNEGLDQALKDKDLEHNPMALLIVKRPKKGSPKDWWAVMTLEDWVDLYNRQTRVTP